MRTFALLLFLSACASAQPTLTPKDESDIRAAIDEQAKKDNQQPRSEIWSERGPIIYRVRHLESIAADVATVDADGLNSGTFFGMRNNYTFILTRTHGTWAVVKKIPVCLPGPMIQPLSALSA
jgi:hypothetical protein